MSSPVYELLKRPDELFVVEHAHLQPRFVEDSVRLALKGVARPLSEPRRRRLPLLAPGEPGDDPRPRRARRAARDGRRAAGELETASPGPPHRPSGLAGRRSRPAGRSGSRYRRAGARCSRGGAGARRRRRAVTKTTTGHGSPQRERDERQRDRAPPSTPATRSARARRRRARCSDARRARRAARARTARPPQVATILPPRWKRMNSGPPVAEHRGAADEGARRARPRPRRRRASGRTP